jgi:hypothetical protein
MTRQKIFGNGMKNPNGLRIFMSVTFVVEGIVG